MSQHTVPTLKYSPEKIEKKKQTKKRYQLIKYVLLD